MANTYIEYLRDEFEIAKSDFEKAKREATDDLKQMTFYAAVDRGAAYDSRIDRVTIAATKLKTLADNIQAYEYFQKEATHD